LQRGFLNLSLRYSISNGPEMTQLVFATHNKNKSFEINKMLEGQYEVLTLSDIGCTEDIPETGLTLEENALIKARYVYSNYKKNCFADDSGLEIDALDNEPGVFSARYAGDEKNDEANMQKVLSELAGKPSRDAQFRTVIALILDGKEFLFEGAIRGTIATEKKGTKGFGYDPVFIPEQQTRTFAEMEPEEKNTISHRALAVKKLTDFLKSK
jgi:XTP/dITP diphosphohydrolase